MLMRSVRSAGSASAESPPSRPARGSLGRLAGLATLIALLAAPVPLVRAAGFGATATTALADLSLPDDRQPILAEVQTDGVAVHAYPTDQSPVRRQANAGDLLRV